MSDTPSTNDLLTEGQRRHLLASLERVERALRGIEPLLGHRSAIAPALFAREAADLPVEFGTTVAGAMSEATATLADLALAFGLIPASTSHLRPVRSLVLSSLVAIEDTASKNLRGYGPIHPDLPERLDPLLDRLHRQVAEIGRALAGSDLHPRTG